LESKKCNKYKIKIKKVKANKANKAKKAK